MTTNTETRRMHWDDEGSLFHELQWLANGSHPYEERSAQDRKLAQDLIDRHIEDTHPEPDGLSDEECETLSEEEIARREEEQATVGVTWPAEDWALADRLLAGVQLVAGYRFPMREKVITIEIPEDMWTSMLHDLSDFCGETMEEPDWCTWLFSDEEHGDA